MKIIHRGQLPPPRIFSGTCPNCQTVVECENSEITVNDAGGRNGGVYYGPLYTFQCPLEKCKTTIVLTEGKYL